KLPDRECVTKNLKIHGFHARAEEFGEFRVYGSDAPAIQELMRADPELAQPFIPGLPYVGAEVIWAVRAEMARTVEDVLCRRTRALFLNAKAALASAPKVACLMARELGRDAAWESSQLADFAATASHFLLQR
ncbi:MAG TPA: glycerol-3-phosphate dehydrogenase C-terminal domain-containing protein, partial [Bryobacteraceae bacterium]|nr:glycerol-3-phosphate dehydrogenase C-terminal domain-containing protein [Bryobacteraceae bacterium]